MNALCDNQLHPRKELKVSDASDKRTTDSIVAEVYLELRKLASRAIAGESPGQTLSGTALVHEAYLILSKSSEPQWDNRGHFYVAAAQTMRRILINRALAKKAQRRGGGKKPVPLPEDSIHAPAAPERDDELIALDEAIEKLGEKDGRKMQVVLLKYFVGLTIEETADVLGISMNTAKRDWRYSRAWLRKEFEGG